MFDQSNIIILVANIMEKKKRQRGETGRRSLESVKINVSLCENNRKFNTSVTKEILRY